MLPRISDCGLIHAEIIQEYHPDGTKKGKPKYRISITDIWEVNREYFEEECSRNEQYQDKNVHEMNDNVQQMNDNVHETIRQRSANEHFVGPKDSPRARSRAAKDNKDILKDSKKESGPQSSIPSSSSVSSERDASLIVNDATNKNENIEPVTIRNTSSTTDTPDLPVNHHNTEPLKPVLAPEEKRVFGLLCEVFYAIAPEVITEKIKKQCATLAPHVKNVEDLKSLRDYTRVKILSDPSYVDKQAHLGNLVSFVNGWKQEQEPLPEKGKPKKTKITPEYLASLPL